MTMALTPSALWLAGLVAGVLCVAIAVVVFRRRRAHRGRQFQSSLPVEGASANEISKHNVSLSEVTGKATLEDTSLFCDIVQRDGRTFRVQKARLDRYDVPVAGNGVAIFVALKERDPFEERVWYLVEERGAALHVLGLASETHPGLIHAFEIVGRTGKQASATLNPADLALLKNFGWSVQDVQLSSPRDRKGH